MAHLHDLCSMHALCSMACNQQRGYCCVQLQTDKEKYNLGNSNAFLYFSNDTRFIVKTMEQVRVYLTLVLCCKFVCFLCVFVCLLGLCVCACGVCVCVCVCVCVSVCLSVCLFV